MPGTSRPFAGLGRAEWFNLSKAGIGVACTFGIVFYLYRGFLNPTLGNDFSHYQDAAQRILQNQNPYNVEVPFNLPLWVVLPYIWSGTWSQASAILVWTILNIALMAATVVVIVQVSRLRLRWWSWLAVLLVGLLVMNGAWVAAQPTILITLMTVFSIWLLQTKHMAFTAGAVGFIFLLYKPQLTLLVAVALLGWAFFYARPYIWGAIVSFGLSFGLSLLLTPTWPYDYVTVFKIENTGAGTKWYLATLLDWLNYSFGIKGLPANMLCGLWVFLGLAAIVWLFFQASRNRLGLVGLVTGVQAVTLVITVYTRDYDYPFLLLPMAYVFMSISAIETRRVVKWITYGLLALFVIYYTRGGYMYELFPLNVLIAGLTFWRCIVEVQQKPYTFREKQNTLISN